MPPQTSPPVSLFDLSKILWTYPLRWLVPALAVAALVTVYAVRRPAIWEASQALMVRDEATTGDRLGKFTVADEMKTVEDTLMELARSRSVMTGALTTVGPPANRPATTKWPSELDVAAQQGATKLTPPHGAEFGKTEIFYLQVQNTDRARSLALAAAVADQLTRRFADLRGAKAQSLVDELSKSVSLAQADLATTTQRLAHMDADAGEDLGELRVLMDAPSGDSPLRRSITEMETEMRTTQAAVDADRELLHLLRASRANQGTLLAAPSRLLESQPELRRLKDGLIDAQLHLSQLLGSMSEDHPKVREARAAEAAIGDQIAGELNSAIRGLEVERNLSKNRADKLQLKLTDARERLDRLAEIRAEYANTVAEAHRRADTLKTAETQLAEARANQAAAHTASLVSRVDAPDTGANPIGMTRATTIALGSFGGLLIGFAVLFLTVPTVAASAVERLPAAGDLAAAHPASLAMPARPEAALSAAWPTADNRNDAGSGIVSFKQAFAKRQDGADGRR